MGRDLLAEARGDWFHLLKLADEGDQRCQAFRPLLEWLCRHPERLRAFPIFSMWSLTLSHCPEYPFDPSDLPWVDLSEDQSQFCLNDVPYDSLESVGQELLRAMEQVTPYVRPPEEESEDD